MGICVDMLKFLLRARQQGVKFDETLTLGRQYMALGPKRIETTLREFGAWPADGETAFRREIAAAKWRLDVIAPRLGVKKLTACDVSDFEGATLVHDMNQPVPAEQEQRFDVLIDGGTLEHVFNFPVAAANCIRMLRVGGHFFTSTPINNYCGHGFYQFSPELFFRVFSPENGFRVKRCIAQVGGTFFSRLFGVAYPFERTGPWYEVSDPATVGDRVQLINDEPATIMFLAEKTAHVTPFTRTPQQSDYVPQWQAGVTSTPLGKMGQGSGLEQRLRALFSEDFCREMLPRLAIVADPLRAWRFKRQNSFSNPKHYRRVEP